MVRDTLQQWITQQTWWEKRICNLQQYQLTSLTYSGAQSVDWTRPSDNGRSLQVRYRMEDYHLNIKTFQLCLWIMTSYNFLYGNVCKGQQINLRCNLQGCQPLKKNCNNFQLFFIYFYFSASQYIILFESQRISRDDLGKPLRRSNNLAT